MARRRSLVYDSPLLPEEGTGAEINSRSLESHPREATLYPGEISPGLKDQLKLDPVKKFIADGFSRIVKL